MRRLPWHVSGKHGKKKRRKTCRSPSCSIASFCMKRGGFCFRSDYRLFHKAPSSHVVSFSVTGTVTGVVCVKPLYKLCVAL